MSNHHARDPLSEDSQPNTVYDPLQKAHRESTNFNRAWLKNGESLRPIQRAGFVIFSICFLFTGFFFADVCWAILREATAADGGLFEGYFSGLAALGFLYLGYTGLKNALKRKRN
jgi:hypothetical protein